MFFARCLLFVYACRLLCGCRIKRTRLTVTCPKFCGGPMPRPQYNDNAVIFLKPTSTKPQAEKLGDTYKIMVATAIYSVTMVLLKETAFPLCRAMERRWKRNVVSRVSSVIVVIRLPIFCVSSMAISCHVPAFKMPFKHKFVLPDVCTVSQWSTGASAGGESC